MKFVRLYGDEYWYLWEEFDMKLRNFKGGWRTIDENSDEWMLSIIIEADSWHDLYKKTGFCPMLVPNWTHDVWMDTLGNTYEGDGHEWCAEKIGEILFGVPDTSGDDLIQLFGWIKLTTGPMLKYYFDEGMYDHLSMEQVPALREWARLNRVHLFDGEEWH
jgi:hypothetical protein